MPFTVPVAVNMLTVLGLAMFLTMFKGSGVSFVSKILLCGFSLGEEDGAGLLLLVLGVGKGEAETDGVAGVRPKEDCEAEPLRELGGDADGDADGEPDIKALGEERSLDPFAILGALLVRITCTLAFAGALAFSSCSQNLKPL